MGNRRELWCDEPTIFVLGTGQAQRGWDTVHSL